MLLVINTTVKQKVARREQQEAESKTKVRKAQLMYVMRREDGTGMMLKLTKNLKRMYTR